MFVNLRVPGGVPICGDLNVWRRALDLPIIKKEASPHAARYDLDSFQSQSVERRGECVSSMPAHVVIPILTILLP